jgi:hypothetical protein
MCCLKQALDHSEATRCQQPKLGSRPMNPPQTIGKIVCSCGFGGGEDQRFHWILKGFWDPKNHPPRTVVTQRLIHTRVLPQRCL